jgi:hypothetical protein
VSSADDATVLTVLRAVPNLNVWDGHVEDSDASTMVISADLPYVVFWGGYDDDAPGDSLAGTSGAHLSDFRVTFVGETREQAKWAGEQARAVLNRKRLSFTAGSRFVRCTDNSGYVTRDDTWMRPGGAPLFSGIDQYEVLI